MEKYIPRKSCHILLKPFNFNVFLCIASCFYCRLWYDKCVENVKISRDLSSLTKEQMEQQMMQMMQMFAIMDELEGKVSWV